ncbi:MAG: tRNA (N6-isopentenyl adenosine(37)-C2)-methylthiotransferase MiaB [Candidatus Omnitrophica bacterium]|nr:tRNA (N6-isopentenyl adenosine(37)-C2)-methylthiotransferase MiaB [Candidatus Omnitrophota bacterium]
MRRTVYLQTYGCQMNERDSEEVLGMLASQGYEIAEEPGRADVILLNTCSVRQHAEERAFGKMGELSVLKQERPELVLGIIGCMAKLRQEEIFKRLPKVDLVAGPAELYDLPYLLAEIQEQRQQAQLQLPHSPFPIPHSRVMAVGRPFRPLDQRPAGDYRTPGVTAFVTILEGCDKACTYCIVPKTRGQEISRPAEEILAEINRLVEAGYQEVTLLGQNVNSYGKRFPDGSGYRGPLGRLRLLEEDPDSLLDFPQLLRLIDASLWGQTSIGVRPLPRVRFTTSHPFDATERLFHAMRECESVCEWLHLPVQSGSTRMLRAMRRGYTAEAYLKKIEQLRQLVPAVSLSTDLIVGFPGETEEDVEATARLMREVRYDIAYLFKYSPRPGTEAAALEDDIPQEVKEERHQRLLALQDDIVQEKHRDFEGRVVEILVEGRGRFAGQWFGRTRGAYGVIIESPDALLGQTVQASITRGTGHTLFGEVVCRASSPSSGPPPSANPPSRLRSPRRREPRLSPATRCRSTVR